MKRLIATVLLVTSVFTMNLLVLAESHTLPYTASATLLNNIFSDRVFTGDRVEAQISEPINLRNYRLFIPIGSIASGEVVEASPSSRGLQSAKLSIRLKTIHFPNGHVIFVDGHLINPHYKTNRFSEFIKQKKSSLTDTPYNPSLEGKSSLKDKVLRIGKIGSSAIVGSPLGAAVATGSIIFDKGGNINMLKGDMVQIQLNSINNTSPSNHNPNNNYIFHPRPRLSYRQ